MATKALPTRYDPRLVEPSRYEEWMRRGYFHASVDPARRPYSIMMPLPNITGELHMGHALNNTIQDLLIRWRRMQGYNAMWMPGTDHASIGTHVVIERALARDGNTRFDLGREAFLEFTWRWKEKYGDIIYSQLRRMGFSCDWDRVTFTMDPHYSDAVIEAWLRLYHKGYVYYGKRMINWCPHDLTSVSDLEVEHEEIESTLYYVRYPGADGEQGVVIATQRPETILADVAVAVHPDDLRYRTMVGWEVIVPIVQRKVPVIADRRVDRDFGTGALKITPGHDPLDNEIGAEHGLPTLIVLDEAGRMTPDTGRYAGMDRFQAREAVAGDLQRLGLIVREESYRTSVGRCSRCHTVVEPYITDQWFVRMQELAAPAIRVVREGQVRFHPERWTRVYLDWMENIRDWNISRRLWWGHRIPAWHCQRCKEIVVGRERPAACARCGHQDLLQEEQILDTWFSSALWPFATLGWPNRMPDVRYFYPTDVLATGRDIIFLWVARMIMFGLEFMGQIPFTDVYINPTVLNIEGRRMSKSLGTGLDPIDYIDDQGYGADVLRYALMLRCSQGQQDLRFSEKMIQDVRNFNTKIWNATRFVLMNLNGFDHRSPVPGAGALSVADRWVLSRYARLVQDVTANLEAYEFDKMAKALYDFIWSEYCDWYLEMAKVDLQQPRTQPGRPSTIDDRRSAVQHTLWYVLSHTMKLLHPIMPFITEEVWQRLPHDGPSIMIASWPGAEPGWVDPQAEAEMNRTMAVIRAIRSLRADLSLPRTQPVPAQLRVGDADRSVLERASRSIAVLANVEPLTILPQAASRPPQSVAAVLVGIEVFLSLGGVSDIEKQRLRLQRAIQEVDADMERLRRKMDDREFLHRAPAEVVERDRLRIEELGSRRSRLQDILQTLSLDL